MQNRFDVKDAVIEQSVVVFASISESQYHQFLSDQLKVKACTSFKENLLQQLLMKNVQ